MYDIFMSNFVTVFLVFGFFLLLLTGNVFEKKIERLFAIGAICVFFLVLVDMVDSYLVKQTTLNELRYFTSALGYTVRPITLGVFISILLRKNEHLINLWIPIIIEGIIAMTNYWTHWMFYLDQNNVFYRGPLGYLPHALSLAYMAILIYYAITKFNVTEIGEIFTVFYVIIICLVAMFFETVYSMKYLLTGAIICGCTIYYTYLYVQVYKTDPVTGLFNRRSFNKDTEKRKNKRISVICVDLNNLKQINDTYGHAEGDKALCTIADTLVAVAKNRYRIYRMGGDEFFVIGINKSDKEINSFIDKVRRKLSETSYSASFGYANYTPGDNFEEVCTKADEAMYLDKKKSREITE